MLQGSMVALVTPMDTKGQVDYAALSKLVDYHVEHKTDAIVAVGTTGESATLNIDEHCQVVEAVVKQVAGRIPVIAGTGANATDEAIELSLRCQAIGVSAGLSVTPYYNKPTQAGLIAHYKAIAAAVDLPQILYNVPSRTACDLLPETVAKLARVDNIIGLKDATGDLSRVRKHQQSCPPCFALYSGDDASSLEFLFLGGHGVISVTANIAPTAMHDLCVSAMNLDKAAAVAIDARLQGLHKDLSIEANPTPVKWAVERMGLIAEGIRLPLLPLTEANQAPVEQAMIQAGVI